MSTKPEPNALADPPEPNGSAPASGYTSRIIGAGSDAEKSGSGRSGRSPYYEAEGVTIFHGDCRKIVPLLGDFDLLLTDPPYGIGRDGSKRTTSRHGGRKAYDFLGWDAERPQRWVLEMLIEKTRNQIIWGGNYFVESLEPSMKWLVWDKGQRIAQSDGELAWTSLEGAMRILTLNRVELMMDGAEHPTQKPEKLMRWCIEQAGDVQTVLDPYAGSGTTGRAAKDLGKRCVLIEREERFCEIAARRLSQSVLSLGGGGAEQAGDCDPQSSSAASTCNEKAEPLPPDSERGRH